MKKVTYASCHITGGFWANMQKLIRETSMHAVYNRFDETGRIGAFRCDWKEGMDNKPHYYWDSDVAKWMESVAYIIRKYPNQELEEAVETLIDQIEKNQGADGYFNIYFTVVMPEKRFSNRDWHELYCAGHLIEAAVAWYETTGRDRFLHMMCRYADYIEKVFIIDGSAGYVTPGHEEIELALVKLYDVTGEKRYIKMVQFFLDHRGYNEKNEGDSINIQAHKPVREQYTAEGHAVRAMYLACAMADVALRMGDKNLKFACEKMFENIINQRMYITGGIGSSAVGEAFTVDYDLPNITAYTETCAAIGLALFAQRMMLLDMNGVYGDVIEKVLYNGFLSGISLDGKAFFYENPLEIPPAEQKAPGVRYPITKRLEVFRCSCCPPNITRFVSSVGDFLYTVDEKGIYCHQFMESVYEGEDFTLMMKTDYPHSGKVRFDYRGQPTTLFVRVPGWCDGFQGEIKNGYASFALQGDDRVDVEFPIKPVCMEASPALGVDCGRYAVMRGPVVYCLEECDNGKYVRDIALYESAGFTEIDEKDFYVPVLKTKGCRRANRAALYVPKDHYPYEEVDITLIPYHAFANRTEGEMLVWVQVK